MQDKFEKAIKDETWIVAEDEANKYLHSSKLVPHAMISLYSLLTIVIRDIVFYFNQTMKRGSALTKAQPFFELYKLFKKYFYRYAEVSIHYQHLSTLTIYKREGSQRQAANL